MRYINYYANFFEKNKKSFLMGSWCEPNWIYNGFNELRECAV